MEPSFIVLLLCLVAIAIFFFKKLGSATFESSSASVNRSRDPYDAEDAAFESVLARRMGPHITGHFFTKVVGITFKNEDGIIGQDLIPHCKQLDFLKLVPEPDNPYDRDAISVRLEDGRRIGYLNRRTAQEITSDIQRGAVWLACVKFTKLPSKTKNGCLVLCLIQMNEAWIASNLPDRTRTDLVGK